MAFYSEKQLDTFNNMAAGGAPTTKESVDIPRSK